MLHRVTSAANPLVKMLKSLHARKGREETGLFLAEGARLALEAADLGQWPAVMAVSPAALERAPVATLARAAAARGVRVIETTSALLGQISKRDNPQTVLGAYPQRMRPLDEMSGDFFVALEGVRDPGNLGTVLRTADCVGASGLILLDQTCDPHSVEAVRASMGSIFSTPVARASFPVFDAWRRARGHALIGASLKGVLPHDAADAASPLVVMMGNEQSGLPEEMERACDALVRIPMRGRADSLNLAAATAIMLYDVWRRRGYTGARR
ncbi:MAG: TrmH family RNA methyltransferase [Hyphomonadaceae bacterium]